MDEYPSDLDITTVCKDDIEDAVEGLPGYVDGESNADFALDELSVLTGEKATSLLELAGSDPIFKKLKNYCESRFDAKILENNANIFEHSYLEADNSAHFIATITNNENADETEETLNVIVFIKNGEVLDVVAIHEHNKHENITEIRVIRCTEDGFKEYVVEHNHDEEKSNLLF
jgi:hypothetical protein